MGFATPPLAPLVKELLAVEELTAVVGTASEGEPTAVATRSPLVLVGAEERQAASQGERE